MPNHCNCSKNKCKSKCNYQCYTKCPPLPPIPSSPIEKKAIALLELESLTIDKDIRDGLYFAWYQDISIPKFPIIETDGSTENNLELLNKYYNEGYRIFLGFSRSTILAGVLQWFIEHPDTIGLSLTSSAISLSVPKNIYRLITPLSDTLNSLNNVSKNADIIYYIYNEDEVISQDFKFLLENNPITKDKLKLYPIINDSSYNVPDLTQFLSDSTINSVIYIGIYQPDLYSNLYNEGLFFEGNQYSVLGPGLDIYNFVEPCASILNKKYFETNKIYSNTSLFYRETSNYTATNLLNALKMIEYFLIDKNINNLASYDGTLQFDLNKDLKYYSILIDQYVKEINDYRNVSIVFDDPLLGKFEAIFI